jgi:hypothetical protein
MRLDESASGFTRESTSGLLLQAGREPVCGNVVCSSLIKGDLSEGKGSRGAPTVCGVALPQSHERQRCAFGTACESSGIA